VQAPWQKLALVSRESLLSTLPTKAGEYALRWLLRRGVDVRLGEAVHSCGQQSLQLLSGETIHADIVIDCMNRGVDTPCEPAIVSEGTKALFRSNNFKTNDGAVWRLGTVMGISEEAAARDGLKSKITIRACDESQLSENQTFTIQNDPKNVYILNRSTRITREVL